MGRQGRPAENVHGTLLAGPGGPPLGLGLNEWLGCTVRADEPRWCQRGTVFALLAGRRHELPIQKLLPDSRFCVHDLSNSGLLARQRSMAWLFWEVGIAQVEFVLPNVRAEAGPTAKRQARDADNSLRRFAGLVF